MHNRKCQVDIMIYVDDLLFIGVQSIINTLCSRMQKEVLLRHTGDLTVGSTIHFLGRNISHKGGYIDISLNNNYVLDQNLASISVEVKTGQQSCNKPRHSSCKYSCKQKQALKKHVKDHVNNVCLSVGSWKLHHLPCNRPEQR